MRIVERFGIRISDFGFRNRELRLFARQSRGASSFRNPQSAIRIGTFRNPQPAIRNALTLIELLVVIVILMTLVGGVIPVLSPNNEARKIREASRSLQTYVMQAQARAARTGRPTGIAFRETSAGSGVALEVFQIEVPPPFTGFSSSSTAVFNRVSLPDRVPQVYEIHFGEGSGNSFNGGQIAIPPRMTRPNDRIRVGNGLFQLGRGNNTVRDEATGILYFLGVRSYGHAELISGGAPPTFAVDFDLPPGSNVTSTFSLTPPPEWSHPSSYRIMRQPVITSESPYTLPAGVAIDMHASGTEGGAQETLFAETSSINTIKQISIMFSPSGGIDSIYYNGTEFGPNGVGTPLKTPITDASRVFLLLGRVENVLEQEDMGKSKSAMFNNDSDEQLAEMQERINWLNLDSRWIVFDARSGRSVVNDNTFVDARSLDPESFSQMNAKVLYPWMQTGAARKFARQMKSGSGR